MSLVSRRGAGRWRLALLVAAALACERSDPLEELSALNREGRFAESLAPLEQAVEDDPSNPLANLLYGEALLRTGDPGGAVFALKRAAEDPDHQIGAGLLLASAQLQTQNSAEAIVSADLVLDRVPDHPSALLLRALASNQANRFEEALDHFDRVLIVDPGNVDAQVQRIVPLIRLGHIDEAEAAMEELREVLPATAEGPAAEALRAQLCAARATFENEQGEREEARERWEGCLAEHRDDRAVLAGAVDFYGEVGDRAAAIALLEEVLADDPAKQGVRVTLAAQMLAAGRRSDAEAVLLESARPGSGPAPQLALADHYRAVDDFAAARRAIERAMEEMPGEPSEPVLASYAEALILSGDLEAAGVAIRKIRTPVYRDVLRGRLELAEGRPEQALASLEAGIRQWPNNAGARALAGRAAEQIGDFERARTEYKEAVREDLVGTSATLNLARLLAAEGQWADVRSLLARSFRERPRDPEALRLAATAAAELGRSAEAIGRLQMLSTLPGWEAAALTDAVRHVASRGGADAALRFVGQRGVDLALPANVAALRTVCLVERAAGREAAALSRVDRALEAHPEAAELHALRGELLWKGGDGEAAERAFERAAELDSGSREALIGLAELAAARGDADRALDRMRRAEAQSGDEARPGRRVAELLLERGEGAAAAAQLDAHLRRHPHDAEAARIWAGLCLAQGRPEQALELARRSLRFGGGDEARQLASQAERVLAEGPGRP